MGWVVHKSPLRPRCGSPSSGGSMKRASCVKIAGSLLVLAGFACLPASAQIDLAGEWNPRFHEDQPERIPGPDIGDYLGIRLTSSNLKQVPVGQLVHTPIGVTTPVGINSGGYYVKQTTAAQHMASDYMLQHQL